MDLGTLRMETMAIGSQMTLHNGEILMAMDTETMQRAQTQICVRSNMVHSPVQRQEVVQILTMTESPIHRMLSKIIP